MPNGYGSITLTSKHTRKPYWVRGSSEKVEDEKTGKISYKRKSIGYYATAQEALAALDAYNREKNIFDYPDMTFKEVYQEWRKEKMTEIKASSLVGYDRAYELSKDIHDKPISSIKLKDLQNIIDNSDMNYPVLKLMKTFYKQIYKFAIRYSVVGINVAESVNVKKYKDKNPNKLKRDKFDRKVIRKLWRHFYRKEEGIVLILLYSGVRIGELLNLKKEHVNLKENYFDIVDSKTESGIRVVPIARKVKPIFKKWYYTNDSEYLIHCDNGNQMRYDQFRKKIYKPLAQSLGIDLTAHCTRHTTISMLAEKNVSQTIIKLIVGHKGAMNLTERVYTHLDVKELIKAINKI